MSESEFSFWLKTATENGLLNRTYSCLSSPGTNRSCGVAIVYSSKFSMSSCTCDDHGRVVGAQFSAGTTVIQVCNIYGPNTAKEGKIFFESLYSILDPSIPCVLCGDFNTVVDASSDRCGCNIFSPWAYNWSRTLADLMETYGLQDVWHLHHPDAKEYTWYQLNSRQASPLDMFWLCSFLLPFIMSVEILPFFRSDHRYVYLKLAISNSVHRGPGLWKFNTSHLKDLSFILMVTRFWESWQTERATFFSLSAWWDAGKIRLRRKICSFSCRTACEFHKRASSLERTLYFLTRRADSGEDVQSLIDDAKTELQQLHCQQARGCRIRANIQLAEEVEASTAYFFNLEKKQGQARLFTAITTVSGVIVKSFSLIAQAWILFYTTLFTAQSLLSSEQDFFLSHLTRFLTFAERRSCKGLLTNEECKAALDQMPTGKSPGLDGLPAEFFKTFWPLMGQDMVDVLNYCYLFVSASFFNSTLWCHNAPVQKRQQNANEKLALDCSSLRRL